MIIYYLFLLFFITISVIKAFNFSECNNLKQCITFPEDCIEKNNCIYVFSYKKSIDYIKALEMELFTINESDAKYVAVGFSKNQIMDDEPVFACIFDNNSAVPLLSKNVGRSNVPFTSNTFLIELKQYSLIDNSLYCKIIHHYNIDVDPKFAPNLTEAYYLLFAKGDVKNRTLLNHGNNRNFVSKKKRLADAFLENISNSSNKTLNNNTNIIAPIFTPDFLVYMHGLLMIVSWIGCIVLGIFSARYMQKTFEIKIFKAKLWFQIHRTLNFIGVILIIIATFFIANAKDFTWSGPWFSKNFDENIHVNSIHSLFGAIAIILAVLQPLNALLRCDPEHEKRYVFKRLHQIIGLTGLVLSLVTIFIGIYYFEKHWKKKIIIVRNICFQFNYYNCCYCFKRNYSNT